MDMLSKSVVILVLNVIIISKCWNWSTIVRPSLFPNYFPSTIKFSVNDNKLPVDIINFTRKHVVWRDTRFISSNLKKLILNSGFRITSYEDPKRPSNYIGIWDTHTKSKINTDKLLIGKTNHFKHKFFLMLGRKDKFHQFIQRSTLFSKNPYEFIPRTFILPEEMKEFKKTWKNNPNKLWIVKPPLTSKTNGIKVINNPKQLRRNESLIIQEYISNYFLLNNSRAVITMYVVVTSITPLRVYLYKDGVVSFRSSSTFLNQTPIVSSNCTHILYDIRFLHDKDTECKHLVKRLEITPRERSFQTYKSFLSNLSAMGYNSIEVETNVQRSVEFVFNSLNYEIKRTPPATYKETDDAYELLSVDYILDKDLRPWLLEFNRTPMLKYSKYYPFAFVFDAVRLNLLADTLNLVGYEFSCTFPESVLRIIARDTNQKFETLCKCSREQAVDDVFKYINISMIGLLEQDESRRKGENFQRVFIE